MKTPVSLSIAGSDSSGGAGIQADIKTTAALGVYSATAITAVTAQNTRGVTAIHAIPPAFVEAQIDAVFTDLNVRAVKTGMLGDEATVAAVANALKRCASAIPIVVDPVMVATSGARLLTPGAEKLYLELLVPLAVLITPNLQEAAVLLNENSATGEDEMKQQAKRLSLLGANAVLVKGGHGTGDEAVDILFDGAAWFRFSGPRYATRNTHGTGCTLSSAIAAFLVLGRDLRASIAGAKAFLSGAIEHADGLDIGHGSGPVSHFYRGATGPAAHDSHC